MTSHRLGKRSWRGGLMGLLALGLTGCGGMWSNGAVDALDARLEQHVDAIQTQTSPGAMHAETDAYARDMADGIGHMNGSSDCCSNCGGTTGGGMMGGTRRDHGPNGDAMQAEVRTHAARVGELSDPNDIRAECTRHHETMKSMLRQMDEMMR